MPRRYHFQSLVGTLLYVAVNMQPNIAISAAILARKVSIPCQADCTEAKQIPKLNGRYYSMKLKLGEAGELEAYVDAYWAGDH